MYGEGVATDAQLAAHWLEIAADLGHKVVAPSPETMRSASAASAQASTASSTGSS